VAAEDLYAVLEVSPGATAGEIRAAFRRLARRHHPDLGSASPARMVVINRAYAVLSDPERRRRYDAGRARFAPAPTAAPSPPPSVEPTEPEPGDPPWRIDFERGDDLSDWRQMYAEERYVWEQLAASRSEPDPSIMGALERATRDQLELENAIRRRRGQPPLAQSDLDERTADARRARAAGAARVGCLLPVVILALAAAASRRSQRGSKSSTSRRGSGTTIWRP
jgi:curved DNA-binding protein CbpA